MTPPRYHLRTFLAGIAAIAIWLGLMRNNPAAGLFSALVALPALAWTARDTRRARERGRPMSRKDIVGCFLAASGLFFPVAFLAISVVGGTFVFIFGPLD